MRRPIATSTVRDSARRLVEASRYEVIPLKNLEAQLEHLPAGCTVSVTCSPAKGLDTTQRLAEQIRDRGHRAVPHLSARLTRDRAHVGELAAWLRTGGFDEFYLVAGDAPEPAGDYDGAVAWLRDFLDCDHGVSRIGITSYPDGHALIPHQVLHDALHAKQALLAEAGIEGSATTQMCFDPQRIVSWLEAERAAGFRLPVHLGIPGVIDRAKLMSMSVRLGIGSSVRYLRKNRGVMGRLIAPGGYDPMRLLAALAPDAERLGIEGVHLFTFNNIEATAAWQIRQLSSGRRDLRA